MKYLVMFLTGVLVGIAAHWYVTQPKSDSMMVQAHERAASVGENLKNTFDTEAIKDELARTGRVVREKARQAGEAVSDAAANARITASIKAKLVEESALTALKIDVDTTDGVVTLSGTVSSHEQIAKAMSIAMETEGVYKVISALQVKPAEAETK